MSEYTREEILKLIEENGGPEGLDLSGRDLSGIDLSWMAVSQESMRLMGSDSKERATWIGREPEGAKGIYGINLAGSRLVGTNLRGANLVGADMEEANLTDAKLERANLTLARLQKANLERANLRNAALTWSSLQGTRLIEADFRDAGLAGVNLRDVDLLWANLQGAKLTYSHLEKVDFFSARTLEGAYFYHAFLDNTRLKRDQLGKEIGEELEGKYGQAKEAYLALKNNFAEIGRYDDAAWAYRKERRMEKRVALQEAKEAWQVHDWKRTLCRYAKVASDQLEECVCDYGESVPRVLCSLLKVYVLFTLIYGLTWSIIRVYATPTAIIREPTRNPIDLARFSLAAMTTMELTGLEPRNGLVELLAGLEALLGIALTGLLGFVVGNRIRRS
jgi:uncharacterized protein YjbI with pentapeptide repeats